LKDKENENERKNKNMVLNLKQSKDDFIKDEKMIEFKLKKPLRLKSVDEPKLLEKSKNFISGVKDIAVSSKDLIKNQGSNLLDLGKDATLKLSNIGLKILDKFSN
jgi:hypothetical protein